MEKAKNEIAYRVEIKVPLERIEEYFGLVRGIGIVDNRPSFCGLSDGGFSYLLSSEEKDDLLNFCVKEGFGSWCWPMIIK